MKHSDIDYEAIASRACDVAVTADERIALGVWSDALEAAGDARGGVIAIEHAMREATGERARELGRALVEHLLAHPRADALLGELTPVLRFPRALTLDWCAGRLIGARLDTRYISRDRAVPASGLVRQILDAPAAASLRRLHVRVRMRDDVHKVVTAVRTHPGAPQLEELAVGISARLTERTTRTYTIAMANELSAVRTSLWFFADHDVLVPLPGNEPVVLFEPPELAPTRLRIGRAITSAAPERRLAGLHAIVTLGPRAFMFVEALMAMLTPGLAMAQMASALSAIGPAARVAIPRLKTMTGRAVHYDADVRRAAGLALAQLG